jgi:putative DNA primase/helicase
MDQLGTTIYTGPTPEDLARIPAALTTRRQWILWRGADRIYKPTGVVVGLDKIPINPQTESKASATNPDTWGGFEECLAALPLNLEKWEQENPDAYRGGGLGFVFASDDPYVGIDLDHCRDPESGEITALAKKIIETLASYAEVSPSGTGVHVWAQGPLPQGRRKKGPVEMYASSRFFTVTGWHLPDTPPTIEEREAQIAAVHWACLGQPDSAQEKSPAQGKRPAGQEAQALALDDTALLDKARSAKNKDKFNRLWNGDDTGYPSPSEADLALCMLLAFWTRDPDQIDRLFRESRLIRDKWDEQHGELTYGEGTIQKALARQTTYYTPPRRDAQRRRNGHTASTPGTTATPGDFFDYPIDGKFKVFIPRLLGEALLARNTYRHTASQLWVYRNGVYLPCGEATLYADAQTLLGNERRTNRLREALSYVEVATQFDDESPPDRTYINLLNGRLAWETGELESHTPEVFTTVQLPIEYDATALCPVFDNYLVTTFSADDIPLIEEILGWCLVPDLRFELAVMLTGEGDNGKSVFLDLVGYLLGEANISNVALQDLEENRFRAAELYGKLANVFADLDARGLQTSSMFKTLTTGDCITAERKHGQPFRFRSYAKLLFSANKIPTSKDKTYAFYKRWLIIPFSKVFNVTGC